MTDGTTQPLWTPSPERAAGTRMAALVGRAGVADSRALHRWSVEDPAAFWDLVWDDTGVIGDRGTAPAFDGERFFADARLSYAENLLGHAPDPDAPAVVDVDEAGDDRVTTWAGLTATVAAAAEALRNDGVGVGDRVAAWLPNVTETMVVALAASAVGATFTSTSPDFGVDGVVDRFGQVDPVVLVATDRYRYGGKEFVLTDRVAEVAGRLPTVRRVVIVPGSAGDDGSPVAGATTWLDWLAPCRGAEPRYERLPFDHPLFVLYSSGTTGAPKCIVHRAGGVLLKHLEEHQYQTDLRPGDRLMYFTTCGWMMWNWLLSALASGTTVVCFDGNPFHPGATALYDVAERYRLTCLGVSAKYIDACRKTGGLSPVDTHDLSALRTVCSTGSPLHADGFEWVHRHVKSDVHLASISGGTDICGCFVGGDPTAPVWSGEIQGPALGMDVDVFDDHGRPCGPGVDGELVCRPTFPSVPLGFWGDHDGSRFRSAYFERFDGWWTQGDFASWTSHDGMVIHGRSDATLNAGGVRIGTAEIYRVVERLAEVTECVAVGQRWDDDTRIVLFVRTADGVELDDELRATIRSAIRSACSPRHVPAVIAAVSDIPRTRSNKISELAVTDVINGREVRNTEALANPEALVQFSAHPDLTP
ncbi:MAG: acetoacetate--CoA ligase [Ilumatobacter sp.]|nr:MAG: acetoacetate--CoA ligase [Ilumatobacter sp.]